MTLLDGRSWTPRMIREHERGVVSRYISNLTDTIRTKSQNLIIVSLFFFFPYLVTYFVAYASTHLNHDP